MPADAPALDEALLQWKYWEPGTSRKGSRSFALEQDGNLVAHGSIWPIDSMGEGV